MDNLAVWLSAISAFFAAIAALANLGQARKSAQGNEVNVYLGMLGEYGSPEMRVALSSLAKFWIDNNGKVSEALSAETYENPEDAKVIRGYLRLVSSYFVNSARLFEAGLISRKLLRLLIAHPGLNVFYEVVVPMSLTKNPHHNSGTYVHLLKRIAKRHGDGKIYYQP